MFKLKKSHQNDLISIVGFEHVFLVRSSHLRCSVKKGVLKTFANFTEKYMCWSLFVIKLPATLLQRDSNTGVFMRNLRNS